MQSEIAKIQAKIAKIEAKISDLDEKRRQLSAELKILADAKWAADQAEKKANRAEFYRQHFDKMQSQLQTPRWSDRWWASEGWKELAECVVGTDLAKSQNLAIIVAAFAGLSDKLAFVVERRFGIGLPKMTLKEVGDLVPRALGPLQVGVSQEQVRQLEAEACRSLRSLVNLMKKESPCPAP